MLSLMRLLNCLCPALSFALLGFCSVYGLVKEDQLIARWSFDEGNGNIANDEGGSIIQLSNIAWGEEAEGNALSRYSFDNSEAIGFGIIEANRKFQVTSSFSILFWFKTNGLTEDYSHILNKGESLNYSYLFQINPGEKVLMPFTGQMVLRASTHQPALFILLSIIGIVLPLRTMVFTFALILTANQLVCWSSMRPLSRTKVN